VPALDRPQVAQAGADDRGDPLGARVHSGPLDRGGDAAGQPAGHPVRPLGLAVLDVEAVGHRQRLGVGEAQRLQPAAALPQRADGVRRAAEAGEHVATRDRELHGTTP
jgi:hypothetical protein